MALKKTPRALIDVLDAEGKITGHELEVFVTYEAEGEKDEMARHFQARVERVPITAEEALEYRSDAEEIMTDSFKTAQEQIASLQDDKARLSNVEGENAVLLRKVSELESQLARANGTIAAVKSALAV